MRFNIKSSEQNTKKGIDYETKALLKILNQNPDKNVVWVDLFEDIYCSDKTPKVDYKIFIQSKNVANMTIGKTISACESLLNNYLIFNQLPLETIDENREDVSNRYILFVREIISKKDETELKGKENKLFKLNELSKFSLDKFRKKLYEYLNKVLQDELQHSQDNMWCNEKIQNFSNGKNIEDVKKRIVADFIDKVEVFMCNKPVDEYIPLELNDDKQLKSEIFDEFCRRIAQKKEIEINNSIYLNEEDYYKQFSGKEFKRTEYDELLYKRLLGEETLNDRIGLSIRTYSLLPVDVLAKTLKSNHVIKNDIYTIFKLYPELIDKIYQMIRNYSTIVYQNTDIKIIKSYIKDNNQNIAEVTIDYIYLKMQEVLIEYNEN